MATRSAVSQPWTLGRLSRPALRAVLIALVAVLAVAMFTLGRATAPDSPVRVTPSTPTVDTTAEAQQFDALLDTPEGRAALAREFGPNAFGQAGISSPTPSTAAPADCPLEGVC
jgi:hypothetical protein